jgi:glucose-6-phosphate isomerase
MFQKLSAYQELKKLAASPFDLTTPGNVTSQRLKEMTAQACGLHLLYGTERIDQATIKALTNLAEESKVYDKMAAMQAGEIINQIHGFSSEQRSVLHTAMRDLFDTPQQSPAAVKAAKQATVENKKLKEFLSSIDRKGLTDLVLIGIGGSDLGPRAIYLALQAYAIPGRQVHFISNVDPDDAALVLGKLQLKKTLVVVVSKSGSTLETLTNETFARSYFEKAGLDPKEHFVAVTGEGSPMDNPARYLASFYMWDYVGGRYSVTSMVGAVMLAFALGYDQFEQILKGAHDMDKVALKKDVKENLPLLSALIGIWNRNFLGYPTVAILPYSQALTRLTAHLQQCDMESNGKRINKQGEPVNHGTGPIIWGEPGTNGQHSFYQLIHQGTDIVPIEFIGFQESQYNIDITVEGTTSQEKLLANLFAQAVALAVGQKSDNPNKVFTGNRPNRTILAKKLTPYTMGALLAYYEHKIAFQGFIWGINSFDQEGVQLGKVLANQIIDLIKHKKDSKHACKEFALGQAMLDQLDRL